MKLTYLGGHGPSITVGNPGAVDPVFMEEGVEVEVPDDMAKALLKEQPDAFKKAPTKPASAKES